MGKLLRFTSLKGGLLTLLMFSFLSGSAQFWIEDFGNDFSGTCASQQQSADGVVTGNGSWTVTNFTVNAAVNHWYISSSELGGIDPNIDPCGDVCANSPFLIDQTLHIGRGVNFEGIPQDNGANYTEYANLTTLTNTRAESPIIDCTGQFTIELDMWYAAGNNSGDKAWVLYSLDGGGNWIDLAELPATGTCAGGEISWDNFNAALPAAANNNANLKIGFRWENNMDGFSEDVSVAVDNVRLSAGPPPTVPTADFSVLDGNVQFCENGCTTFLDQSTFDPDFSTGAAFATYEWTFDNGVDPALTSVQQNPFMCFPEPGFYTVTLIVTDNIGASTPYTEVNVIEVLDCGPVIDIDASQTVACANEECIDFFDLSTGNDVNQWLWTFTSASGLDIITSNLQNPTNICLNEVGFYDVTLQAWDLDGMEEATFPNYIEILDCSGPDIDFSADRVVVCPGECIQFTDMSTSNGTITAWEWTVPGGVAVGDEATPGMSTQQNPLVCYENPGSYNVTLSATDQEGPSAITKTISITVDPCTGPPDVNIGASATVICAGDCVDFMDQSLGLVEEYLWVFQGIEDVDQITSTERNPSTICYPNPGIYDVTLTVSNSNGQVDSQTFVDFITVEACTNPPVPRIEVSADTICAGKCVDYTSVSTGIGISAWEWNFQGAVDGSQFSTLENPSDICYDVPGSYSVSLKVTGAAGDSTIVFDNVVTVISTPECRPVIEPMIPDTICAGDCALFDAIITDADSVRWTFDGGNPATSTAFNPGIVCFDELGDHVVMIEAWNASGPAQPIVESVYAGERPPLNAGPDRTINAGAVIELTADVGGIEDPSGSFIWEPYDLVDDFRAQTVRTSPTESTIYIVSYYEPGTCTAMDTVLVNVNFRQAIGVPSAFSPNGDGNNDQLRVLGQGIAKMDFKVFDRYGQLVWQTTNQAEGWDGRVNGKELNPATFVYTLEVTFAEGEREVYTGNTTLVR